MKKTVNNLIWVLVSRGTAISIAVVTGFVQPAEKVNALWTDGAAGCFYVIT